MAMVGKSSNKYENRKVKNIRPALNSRSLGELPLLLAENKEAVFILGLGTGVTLGTVLTHDIRQVLCLEIEHRVVEAAQFFSHVNGRAFQDKRARIIIDDARSFLKNYPGRFDIIINEPSNPWIRGIANLFTVEFFQLCRAKLTEQGLICQWLHLYGMSETDCQTALRSFLEVFPEAMFWQGSHGDILMIGSKYPLKVDEEQAILRFEQHHVAFGNAGISSINQLLTYFIAFGKSILPWTLSSPLNRDNLPILEFTTPLHLYNDESAALLQSLSLHGYRDIPFETRQENSLLAQFLFFRAMQLLDYHEADKAKALLELSYEETPTDPSVIYNLAMIYAATDDFENAQQLLIRSLKVNEQPILWWGLANIYHNYGKYDEALAACEKTLHLEPEFPEAQVLLETIKQKLAAQHQDQ
ncbi:tetratricopeptide repeat protein [candidate division CSSED10-310 bacterium]|uniref:Tetratricopeptide repeat protein n=1 Tax=candidate division CSSED10-310 bacterium TaxID=2855610 RepID=A0ABV6YZW9_UNCC1